MEGAQERVKERLVCCPELVIRRVQDEPLYSGSTDNWAAYF